MKHCTFCSTLVADFICKHGKEWKCYFCANRHFDGKIVDQKIRKKLSKADFAINLLKPRPDSRYYEENRVKVDSVVLEDGIIPPFNLLEEHEFNFVPEAEGLLKSKKPVRSISSSIKKNFLFLGRQTAGLHLHF